MKKLFKVLLNLISFGIPLFIEMLTRSIKFNKLVNQSLEVVLIDEVTVIVKSTETGKTILSLEIDRFSTQNFK